MHPDFESVDIGRRNLRYLCRGAGRFTVVLEQGQGDSVEEGFSQRVAVGWPKVCLALQGMARTFVYDRAGLGWSDKAPEPRTSRDLASDLRAVLQTLRISPPYILVGHSIGGFTVRHYANSFPNEVGGVVLVDSAHPDQQARLSPLLPPPPPPPRREKLELHCLRPNPREPLPGGVDFASSAEQIRALRSLGNLPVTVVRRGFKPIVATGLAPHDAETIERVWAELQSDLLGVSMNSSLVSAEGAGHDIPRHAPEVVIDAISGMIERAARTPMLS